MNRPEVQNKGPGAAHREGKLVKDGTSHKGIGRKIRENKRTEAEIRQDAEHERDHPNPRKHCVRCAQRTIAAREKESSK